MEKQKQFIPEQLDSYLIGGCQHSSRSDQLLQIKCSKENSPRVPLVAVKTGLYNPMQPTFRMNEIEHYQGKRVDELSRKTFPLELGEFYILKINKSIFLVKKKGHTYLSRCQTH